MKKSIDVLGDLANALGNHAGPLINRFVSSKDFLEECFPSDDHLINALISFCFSGTISNIHGVCGGFPWFGQPVILLFKLLGVSSFYPGQS